MKQLILSGILLALVALGAREGLASPRITIDACNGVDVKAVDRILDLEYRDAGHGPLFVRLSCADKNVTVRVKNGESSERVLVVDLSAVLTVAKPRTIALLIVELSNEIAAVSASSARLNVSAVPEAIVPEAEPASPSAGASKAPAKAALRVDVYDPTDLGAPGTDSSPPEQDLFEEEDTSEKRVFDIKTPRLSGALGYSMVSQDFTTPDFCTMCNYTIEIGAPSANVGANIDATYGSRYLFAADVEYQYAASQIHLVSREGPEMVETGFQLHRFNASAQAGYEIDRSSSIAAYGRTGLKYESRVIENQDLSTNTAKLPSELHSGVTVGAMVEFAKLTPKASLGVSADMLLFGKVQQTEGLTDGIVSSTKAYYMGAELDYQWTASTNVTWNYGYSTQSTTWEGWDPTSLRDHQAGYASRSDSVHTLFAGLSTAL
jgi:hypothetical protein